MAAATTPRKSISIYDYPEHLNPFHEEDNHNKIRFWTIGKRLNRSNSISFSGLKDFKNSWALRSFMKKGKKGTSSEKSSTTQLNGDSSPIVYRRALQYSTTADARSTVASPERGDRYVYGGSITPLPRSRFQERLRSTSHHEVQSLSATPRLARSEVSGSRLSVESTNPFEEDGPVPPVRASRRKKKRAPLPPGPVYTTVESADTTVSSVTSGIHSEIDEKSLNKTEGDLELEDMNLNIELKIVEDEDVTGKSMEPVDDRPTTHDTDNNNIEVVDISVIKEKPNNEQSDTENHTNIPESKDDEVTLRNSSSEEDILSPAAFPKVDIVTYRRNSSVNEDDIRLRRGNLEDFHLSSNKRSKSLTNALDATYTTYDINLNEHTMHMDTNGNDGPKKVVCKLYDDPQTKKSVETISSTEKEFLEIDRATRELEREINKLNSALNEDDIPCVEARLSVSEIKRRFDKNEPSSPNPIPKPRRSHYGGGSSTP